MLLKIFLKLSWDEFSELPQPNACINVVELSSSGAAIAKRIGAVEHLAGV